MSETCNGFYNTGSLVYWLWEETHVLKVVGSNPGTIYEMELFSPIFVVKIVMMFV